MDVFLLQPTAHCHAPQPDRVLAIQLKNEIEARAVTIDESISSIIHSALRTYPLSAAGELSKNAALMLMIRRQHTVETVDADGCLPEKLRKTEDEYFRLNVKKLIALAFVPVDEITTGFDLIVNQFADDADDLLDYFEKTWIGEPKRRGTSRKKPQF
ncbi:unnamed protein product [Rotaria sordida]|uniref:Uncharacterized protein n=1 Tax=Rotaria sordida TaxID=392033 RepID=A0A818XE83_9BILA|nr:unnamed protein product [Rotaria sordida]